MILEGPDGWRASGKQGQTRYWLSCTASFECTFVNVITSTDAGKHELKLHRTMDGWKDANGLILPCSRNALDPDIACTALTNTYPIRRLEKQGIADATIDVLFIPVPTLSPRIVSQRYTKVEDGWRYENTLSGFTALLSLDKDGLVTDYPGVCKRTKASS
ncbi:putative glycolipid-binding domain-containing protein [uncultured Sulfitobacter sp.]|uniref:putative glycolipid-binding domain-containing protein n=1 Tax=uncultured Sulfitobacter sp. TaxID=191468 RepID=UPI002619A665|nr:putative glycolipid-binding domain-containing protein [uncultured Sulfitobacter sp.]